MNWFRHYGNGVHAGEWLWLAMVILLALVPGIALLKLVIWLLTPERDKDESEEAYWRMHGRINVLRARRKSFVLSAHPAHNSWPFEDGHDAEPERRKKGISQPEPVVNCRPGH